MPLHHRTNCTKSKRLKKKWMHNVVLQILRKTFVKPEADNPGWDFFKAFFSPFKQMLRQYHGNLGNSHCAFLDYVTI
jgi:hypothetical protein